MKPRRPSWRSKWVPTLTMPIDADGGYVAVDLDAIDPMLAAQVLVAGRVAQALRRQLGGYMSSDYQRANDFVARALACAPDDRAITWALTHVEQQCAHLLRRHRRWLDRTATALLDRRRLSGAEIQQLKHVVMREQTQCR